MITKLRMLQFLEANPNKEKQQMHCTEQEVLVCQHVFEGAQPEFVLVDGGQLRIATCSACAETAPAWSKELAPACPHDGIPNQALWALKENFPADGIYQLIGGKYCCTSSVA